MFLCLLFRVLAFTFYVCSIIATSFLVNKDEYILLPLLRLTPTTEGFPWDDLRKILHGGQRMAKVHSGEEILPKGSTP